MLLAALARKFPRLAVAAALALSCGPLASLAHAGGLMKARHTTTSSAYGAEVLALYQLSATGLQAAIDDGDYSGRRPRRM
jgi:hypothetical protein